MAPRRLLLVGEGNFSFAVALGETLDPNTSLTATCPQRSADLARDLVARENIQRLRERGSEAPLSTKPRPAVAPLEVERVGIVGIQGTWPLLLVFPGASQVAVSGKTPACQCKSRNRCGFLRDP